MTLTPMAIVGSNRILGLLAVAVGRDIEGKLSPLLYYIAIAAVFRERWFAGGIYVLVTLMWLIPDRRIERALGALET